jgi:ribosomal protein S12 methylthiotransferase
MPSKNLTVSRTSEEPVAIAPDDGAQDVRPQKVGFVSLGCPKNLVDSEVMMGLLARAGAELSPRVEDADTIVVNTYSSRARSRSR